MENNSKNVPLESEEPINPGPESGENRSKDRSRHVGASQNYCEPSSFVNNEPIPWDKLKRIAIPTFSGDIRDYENWSAVFKACIDKAPMSDEYKLLQLRQYLAGDALGVINGLGHSKSAYIVAKERLERKYGGERRSIALYLEELDHFQPIKLNQINEIERLADLLDVLVIKLQDSKKANELGSGLLYIKIQQKLPLSMLSQYHKWCYENHEEQSVITLRKWILLETEFQKIAHETTKGLNTPKQKSDSTFFGQSKPDNKSPVCGNCQGEHATKNCSKFLALKTSQRWEVVKRNRLCIRCLKKGHRINACYSKETCNISDCDKKHHSLLHTSNEDKEQKDETSDEEETDETVMCTSATISTMQTRLKKGNFVALRTLPVIIKHGESEMIVNALLDDASTKSFVNTSVVNALEIEHKSRSDITVNVLNGNTKSFETSLVQLILSLNRQKRATLSAYTTENVTADLEAVDWEKYKSKFNHLRNKTIPTPSKEKG